MSRDGTNGADAAAGMRTAVGVAAVAVGAAPGALRATAVGDDAWLTVDPGSPDPDRGAGEAAVVLLPAVHDHGSGRTRREVVVDGWRFEVEVEPERRARLRERAARAGARTAHHGGLEVRAVIPGRVVSVAVNPGDEVQAGDRLVGIEA